LDENLDNNTDVHDSSDYGNDGTASKNTDDFHSPDCAEGAGCFDFDGSADYIDCGSDSSLHLRTGFTLSAWAKPETAHTGYILSKAQTANGYRMYFHSDKTIYLVDGGGENNGVRPQWHCHV